MLWRLWFVLSLIWAACVIGAQMAGGDPVRPREIFGAIAPFLLGLLVRNIGRYVLTGSFRRQRL